MNKNIKKTYESQYNNLFLRKLNNTSNILQIGNGDLEYLQSYFTTAKIYDTLTNNNDIKFDIILVNSSSLDIDINLYLNLLTDDGLFIIENVEYFNNIKLLEDKVPSEYKKYILIYDLRTENNIENDILFIINKSSIDNINVIKYYTEDEILSKIESVNLKNLIDNNATDKNTTHCYLNVYQNLFTSKKDNAKNVLEIGIGRGGSIKLWNDYFKNAQIYGVDISPPYYINYIRTNHKMTFYPFTDGYDTNFININFKNNQFDIIIDDGPHTLDSFLNCIKLYLNLLTNDGIFIIEDVPSMNWIPLLVDIVPTELKKYIKVYDLTRIKNRFDDILFVIDKN